MRYVTELTLHNWGPFKGTHTLQLTDTVYAVVAQHEADTDRSNWIGKTWFLSSMLFALTGIKPESCKVEDGLITHDEPEMYVELKANDGTRIKRSRKRTRSTQLEVWFPGQKVQKQAAAQANLYLAMGLDDVDLLATSFVRQKAIARLILADPIDRTKIVNGWMELEPLQRAEEWLRKQHNQLMDQLRQLAPGDAPEGDLDELRGLLEDAVFNRDQATEDRDSLQTRLAETSQWQQHSKQAAEFSTVRDEGRALRAEVDAWQAPDLQGLEHTSTEAIAAKARAMDRQHELQQLKQGDWDGSCPLTCEACPEEATVRAVGASMELELNEAEIVLDEADSAAQAAQQAHAAASADCQAQQQRERRLVQLRTRAQQLAPSVEYIQEHGEPGEQADQAQELRELNAEVVEYTQEVATLQARIAAHEKHAQAAQAAAERSEALEGDLRTHREALAIVGRQGAQREVAERALAKIQRGANTRLQGAGIDLTVEVMWAREGRGLASHCDACGAAHPKSLKVKTCQICGATRGPKLVEKLDIKPSDRSGAADDIAGLVFQLSASAWLRGKRSASWSSTCIDEPFASLDKANSRALGTHLHALIRGNQDFDQGFLVAHDSQAMDSLPARIQIYGSAEGAVVEVVD